LVGVLVFSYPDAALATQPIDPVRPPSLAGLQAARYAFCGTPAAQQRSQAQVLSEFKKMSVHALHDGIQYEVTEVRPGEWQWSFKPPNGANRMGRVVGDYQWAVVVARRAIDVWHLMNRDAHNEAA
jgi:hypothetical protein